MAITSVEWGNLVPLQAYIGESFQVDFEIKDKVGTLVAIGGAQEIRLQIRKKPGLTDAPLFDISLGSGITVAGNSNQIARTNKILTLPKAGVYYYDLLIVMDATFSFYPYHGPFTGDQRVTQP